MPLNKEMKPKQNKTKRLEAIKLHACSHMYKHIYIYIYIVQLYCLVFLEIKSTQYQSVLSAGLTICLLHSQQKGKPHPKKGCSGYDIKFDLVVRLKF